MTLNKKDARVTAKNYRSHQHVSMDLSTFSHQVVFYDRHRRWTTGKCMSHGSELQSALKLLDAPKVGSTSSAIGRFWHFFAIFSGFCYHFSRLALMFLQLLGAEMALESSAVVTQMDARLRLQRDWAERFRQMSPEKWREVNEKDRLRWTFSFLVCCLDVVLGLVLMLVLHQNWHQLVSFCASLRHWAYSQQLGGKLVPWLLGAPADFKLNRELTSFAGSLFLSMFSLWDLQLPLEVLQVVGILGRSLVYLCAMMGASVALTLLMDMLAMVSLPLFVAYVGTSLCWRMAARSLYSLCLLFQGWKYNILRSRVDHHNFSLDQLLIGVILLSIVVFLLPSLFMFYSCFTAAWLLVLSLHGLLGLLVVLCNFQPICLLLCLWLEPWHHGLTLEMLSRSSQTPVPHLYLQLKPRPAVVMDLFQPVAGAWWSYLQQCLAGALRRLVCGQIWALRSPLKMEMRLPTAKSLDSD